MIVRITADQAELTCWCLELEVLTVTKPSSLTWHELTRMWVCRHWWWGLLNQELTLSSSFHAAWSLSHRPPLMMKMTPWVPTGWFSYQRPWSFCRSPTLWLTDEIHHPIWEELPCEDDCLKWFWWLSQWVWLADAAWSPRWSLRDTNLRSQLTRDTTHAESWTMKQSDRCWTSLSPLTSWWNVKNWWSLAFLCLTWSVYDIESWSMTILRILALDSSDTSGMSSTLPLSVPE